MSVVRIALADVPATPWKNGGGTTRQLLSWPPNESLDTFSWRVSVASIAAGGPFSVFPGIERTIALLDGAGVHLRGPGIDHRLDVPFRPFAFSGDVPLECELLGAGSTDVNVMSRREHGSAEVGVHDGPTIVDAAYGLTLCLRGMWAAEVDELAVGDCLWWAETQLRLRLTPGTEDAVVLVCRWTPRASC